MNGSNNNNNNNQSHHSPEDERLHEWLADALGPHELSDEEVERMLDEASGTSFAEDTVSRILAGSQRENVKDSGRTMPSSDSDTLAEPFHPADRLTQSIAVTETLLDVRVDGVSTASKAHTVDQVPSEHSTQSDKEPRPVNSHAPARLSIVRQTRNTQRNPKAILAAVSICLVAAASYMLKERTEPPQRGDEIDARIVETAPRRPVLAVPIAAVERFAEAAEGLIVKDQLLAGETFRTGPTELALITLDDGSVLDVNNNTEIRVHASRHIEVLEGEIYNDVAQVKDANGDAEPFVVESNGRSIKAIGTRFGVRAEDANTDVLVTQGKVAVSGINDILTNGQLARVTPTDLSVEPAPRASELLNWTQDLYTANLVPKSKYKGGALVTVDPNGQETRLGLRRYHVDVHIEDGFARTTIDQTYFNATHSRQEGTFHFPLPQDASLSRLAMYVNGVLMEGGMAERQHARNTYEQIRHTRRDPALLEWVDGSTFKMRVFPLEPRREKRIVISYTQKLDSAYGKLHYRFPAGHSLEVVGDWSTQVRVKNGAERDWQSTSHELQSSRDGGDLVLESTREKATFDRDLVLQIEDAWQSARKEDAVRLAEISHDGSRYLMMRYRPNLKGRMKQPQRNWIILFEASGDRDPLLARVQIEVVRTLLKNAEHTDSFAIIAAGTKPDTYRNRTLKCTSENIDKAIKYLEETHLVGAINLEKALGQTSRFVHGGGDSLLVHVGSAIPVLGEREESELATKIPRSMQYVGVGIGNRWSRSFMDQAARRTGGIVTQINPDEKVGWRAFELFSSLNTPRLLDIKVSASDGKGRFLLTNRSISQGEEVCAISRVKDGRPLPESIVIEGRQNNKPFRRTVEVASVQDEAGYLPRTWARLEINRLVDADASGNRDKIIELSKKSYVMSPFTSLLVLEDDNMYKQFQVDRGRTDHWAMYNCPKQIEDRYESEQQLAEVEKPVEGWENTSLETALKSVRFRRDWRLGAVTPTLPRIHDAQHVYSYFTTRGVSDFMKTDDLGVLSSFDVDSDGESDDIEGRTVWLRLRDADRLERSKFLSFQEGVSADEFWIDQSGLEFAPNVSFTTPVMPMLRPAIRQYPLGWARQELDWSDDSWWSELDFTGNGTRPAIRFTVDENGNSVLTDKLAAGFLYGGTRADIPAYVPWESGLIPDMTMETLGEARTINGSSRRGLADNRNLMVFSGGSARLLGLPGDLRFEQSRDFGRHYIPKFSDDGLNLTRRGQNYWGFVPADSGIGIPIDRYAVSKGLYARPFSMSSSRVRLDLAEQLVSDLEAEDVSTISGVEDMIRIRQIDGRSVLLRQRLERLLESSDSERRISGALRELKDEQRVLKEAQVARHRWKAKAQVAGEKQTDGEILIWSVAGNSIIDGNPVVYGDLLSRAVGLNTSESDVFAILANEGGLQDEVRGRIDEGARELIERARSTEWELVELPEGTAQPVSVYYNGRGDFRVDRTLDAGLQEQRIRLGDREQVVYPELEIAGERKLSEFHRHELQTLIPWYVPAAADLSASAEVRLVDDSTVDVLPLDVKSVDGEEEVNSDQPPRVAKEGLSIRLKFSQEGHLAERHLVNIATNRPVLKLKFSPERTVRLCTAKDKILRTIKYGRPKAEAAKVDFVGEDFVVVPLPIRSAEAVLKNAEWEASNVDYASMPESVALSLILADFTDNNSARAIQVLNARFLAKNDRRNGLYVLLASYYPAAMQAYGGVYMPTTDSDLGQFITDYARIVSSGDTRFEMQLPKSDSTLLTNLAKSHNLKVRWKHGLATQDRTESQVTQELDRALAFVETNDAVELNWPVLENTKNALSRPEQLKRVAKVMGTYADDSKLGRFARQEQIRTLFRATEAEKARELFIDDAREQLTRGMMPPLPKTVRDNFLADSAGAPAWKSIVDDVVDASLRSPNPMQPLMLGAHLRTIGDTKAAERVVSSVAQLIDPEKEPRVALATAEQLRLLAKRDEASTIVDKVLKQDKFVRSSQLWRYAATLEDEAGRNSRSLARLEKAIAIDFEDRPDVINLAVIRADYEGLLNRYKMVVEASKTLDIAVPEGLKQKVMAAADQWRMLDDDDTKACQLAAEILKLLGDEDMAWAYLTTPVAVDANSSSSWLNLARVLVASGDASLADEAFNRSFEYEQTNPQILLEHAQWLTTRGESRKSRKLLKQISENKWQPRFEATRQQASQLLSQ